MEQERVTSMPATVYVPIQPISPGRREDECHGRFRSPHNYLASQDQDRQPVVHRRIQCGYYSTRLQMSNILVHLGKSIMDKAQGTLMFDGQILKLYGGQSWRTRKSREDHPTQWCV